MNKHFIDYAPDLTFIFCIAISCAIGLYAPVFSFNLLILNVVGWIFIGAGVATIFYVISLIRKNSPTSNVTQSPPKLMTTGIYAISRNPFYLAYLFVTLGAAMVWCSLIALVGPLICFVVLNYYVIPFEETRLKEVFGQVYVSYVAKVRRWL